MFVRAVAFMAMLREERGNLRIEVDGLVGGGAVCSRRGIRGKKHGNGRRSHRQQEEEHKGSRGVATEHAGSGLEVGRWVGAAGVGAEGQCLGGRRASILHRGWGGGNDWGRGQVGDHSALPSRLVG